MSAYPKQGITYPKYPYAKSPTGYYSLQWEGVEVMTGDEASIWRYLHTHTSYSVTEALTNQGWKVVPEETSYTIDRRWDANP